MQNPLSLRAFLSWVEKQPADKRYDYWDTERCACAQYAASLGMDYAESSQEFWWQAEYFALTSPHTFGALASRLREQVQ